MNIILVCIGNFQEYILDNIDQLIKLNIKNIYIITDLIFFDRFKQYNITLIDANELNEYYDYQNRCQLNKEFRDGFWTFTSLRFFYIYSLMEKLDLRDCIHIENDVLIYYDIQLLVSSLNKNYLYIPFDTYNRNIASIMYIPSPNIFKIILDQYDIRKNDMENFKNIKSHTGLIQNFPIFPTQYASSDEELFVSENFNIFNMIFDAAAIGQFLGGIDPQNSSCDSTGFINETCIIKYNIYNIIWEIHDNIKRPFIIINDAKIPIFNLHIHSKNLIKFM